MLVSIIINCFNGEKYLKEAIDSVYAQTYHEWEIIFWDNRSTDKSATIAKNYDNKLRYFLSKEHTSLGEARNLALKKARGDYVSFLDCDDLYLPYKTSTQLNAMQQSGAVLSYGSWNKINQNGHQLGIYKVESFYGEMFESLLSNYNVNFQTLMIEHSFLKKNKISFDNQIKFSTDHNLVLRIAYHEPIMSINKVLANYRIHLNSLSATRKDDKYSDFHYTIKMFEKLGANEKYKNFKKIALSAKYKMFLRDSLSDHKYLNALIYILKFLFKYIKLKY